MSSKMQFEAAWALTNIASGNHDQTLTVVELGSYGIIYASLSNGTAGAVESFRKLLSSKNAELQEQSIWAVANIAGDGPGGVAADSIASHGYGRYQRPMFETWHSPTLVGRHSCWAEYRPSETGHMGVE